MRLAVILHQNAVFNRIACSLLSLSFTDIGNTNGMALIQTLQRRRRNLRHLK